MLLLFLFVIMLFWNLPHRFQIVPSVTFLKLNILFTGPSSDDTRPALSEARIVSALQEQAQMHLNRYIQTSYPNQPNRFGKLLLMLPELSQISAKSIQELFFKKSLGDVQIETLILNMHKGCEVPRSWECVNTRSSYNPVPHDTVISHYREKRKKWLLRF